MMLIFTIYWFFSVRTAEIEVKNSRGKKVPRIFLELSDNKKCIKMFTCAMQTHIYAYLVLIRCLSAPTKLFFAPEIQGSCCADEKKLFSTHCYICGSAHLNPATWIRNLKIALFQRLYQLICTLNQPKSCHRVVEYDQMNNSRNFVWKWNKT